MTIPRGISRLGLGESPVQELCHDFIFSRGLFIIAGFEEGIYGAISRK
jgi:hypothetical protein